MEKIWQLLFWKIIALSWTRKFYILNQKYIYILNQRVPLSWTRKIHYLSLLPFLPSLLIPSQTTVTSGNYLLHIFFYVSGATTIGFTSVVEFWLDDDLTLVDIQHVMVMTLSFSGITLMALVEAFFMFSLVEKLKPLLWAEHNIQYLHRLLHKEILENMECDSLYSPNAERSLKVCA